MTVTIANDPDRLERPRSISVVALGDSFHTPAASAPRGGQGRTLGSPQSGSSFSPRGR
jgi:hypothetical protein